MTGTTKDTQCLGLVGGLGPAATIHYYRELLARIERHARTPRILIAHADVNRVFAFASAKDFDGLARYLNGLIENMATGGAQVTAIVAATPHICAPQLVAISPLPLIDMLAEVSEVVKARGLKRVALLGTRFTIESKMFGRLGDVEVVMPKSDEIDRVHQLYTKIVGGSTSEELLDEVRQLAYKFVARDGAQAVIIAGTDLSPLLTESNCDFPLVDCASVHIDAIARRMIA